MNGVVRRGSEARVVVRALVAMIALGAVPTLGGCAHAIVDTTIHATAPRQDLSPPPPDQAVFMVFHGGRDSTNVVLFTGDGTPVCQVPGQSHCAMALTPGHYRIYITWDRVFSDAIDLDVVGGRTYYATLAMGWGFVDEKLTPAQDGWARLPEYMQGQEVGLDPARASELREELGDFQELIDQADHRMERYDERHIEAHTLHPDDGV